MRLRVCIALLLFASACATSAPSPREPAGQDPRIANLQRAVELDPARIYHRLELARIYADRKRYQEARDQLGRIASLPDRELLDPLYRERAAALGKRIADKS